MMTTFRNSRRVIIEGGAATIEGSEWDRLEKPQL